MSSSSYKPCLWWNTFSGSPAFNTLVAQAYVSVSPDSKHLLGKKKKKLPSSASKRQLTTTLLFIFSVRFLFLNPKEGIYTFQSSPLSSPKRQKAYFPNQNTWR